MDRRLKNPTILEANFFYLLIVALFIFLGSMAQQWDLLKGLVITEYLIILLPTVLFIVIRNLIVKGNSLKKVLRLNRISFKQAIMVSLITVLSYPFAVLLNTIAALIISRFGELKPSPVPIPQTGSELLIGLFVIAISAGICEEVMFRGLMLNAYERLGKKKAIIFSAILFGVFHFNPQNLLGPIFLGIIFGIILLKTNSIFSAMLAHATNNAIALLLGMAITKLQNLSGSQSMEELGELNNLPMSTQIISFVIAIVFWGGFFIGCAFGVYYLIKALPKGNISEEGLEANEPVDGEASNLSVGSSKLIKVLSATPIVIVGIAYVWFGYLIITM